MQAMPEKTQLITSEIIGRQSLQMTLKEGFLEQIPRLETDGGEGGRDQESILYTEKAL